MKNIFLIGYMGTGKSTLALYLSQNYGLEILEMDEMIVRREGMSIADVFSQNGEEYFRDAETKLLLEIENGENQVVSCGGGAVLRDRNLDIMKKSGLIVLLTAEPETILERVKDDDSRPLLRGNKSLSFIRDMMEKRREKYESAADIIIHTDHKSIQQICEEILIQIEKRRPNDV